MRKEMSLAELNPGESACIMNFKDKTVFSKMVELGCLPGEIVTLERKAPMGDPIIINTAGGKISLRKAEATTIIVSENTLPAGEKQ
ncbi:MAG: ferrous iron transport protein A [Flavobacteriales bacterium]